MVALLLSAVVLPASAASLTLLSLSRNCPNPADCGVLQQSATQTITLQITLNQTLSAQALALLQVVSLATNQVANADFTPTQAYIPLVPGQLVYTKLFTVLADSTPQLDQQYRFTLSAISGSIQVLASNSTFIATIAQHNDPYGVFGLALVNPVSQAEGTVYSAPVIRSFGTYGAQNVTWVAQWISSGPNSLAAQLSSTSGVVTFAVGAVSQTIQIFINVIPVPDPETAFSVTLTSVTGGGRLGSSVQQNVTIPTNNDANGVFTMQTPSLRVLNSQTIVNVTVLRTAGLYGDVTVAWSLQPASFYTMAVASAAESVDYNYQYGTVSFAAGQSSAPVSFTILQNNFPEPDLSLLFLLDSTQVSGGARVSSLFNQTFTMVTIAAHSQASGSFGFSTSSLAVTYNSPPLNAQQFQLTVVRSGGTYGSVQIAWHAFGAAILNQDYSPASGVISFAENQVTAAVVMTLLVNPVPTLKVLPGIVGLSHWLLSWAVCPQCYHLPCHCDHQ